MVAIVGISIAFFLNNWQEDNRNKSYSSYYFLDKKHKSYVKSLEKAQAFINNLQKALSDA
ncbi:MAG: hypothetical protein MI921_28560 [Cytophagales bacterium]|nr:hypothetical protein [Cytophagales bacterium]